MPATLMPPAAPDVPAGADPAQERRRIYTEAIKAGAPRTEAMKRVGAYNQSLQAKKVTPITASTALNTTPPPKQAAKVQQSQPTQDPRLAEMRRQIYAATIEEGQPKDRAMQRVGQFNYGIKQGLPVERAAKFAQSLQFHDQPKKVLDSQEQQTVADVARSDADAAANNGAFNRFLADKGYSEKYSHNYADAYAYARSQGWTEDEAVKYANNDPVSRTFTRAWHTFGEKVQSLSPRLAEHFGNDWLESNKAARDTEFGIQSEAGKLDTYAPTAAGAVGGTPGYLLGRAVGALDEHAAHLLGGFTNGQNVALLLGTEGLGVAAQGGLRGLEAAGEGAEAATRFGRLQQAAGEALRKGAYKSGEVLSGVVPASRAESATAAAESAERALKAIHEARVPVSLQNTIRTAQQAMHIGFTAQLAQGSVQSFGAAWANARKGEGAEAVGYMLDSVVNGFMAAQGVRESVAQSKIKTDLDAKTAEVYGTPKPVEGAGPTQPAARRFNDLNEYQQAVVINKLIEDSPEYAAAADEGSKNFRRNARKIQQMEARSLREARNGSKTAEYLGQERFNAVEAWLQEMANYSDPMPSEDMTQEQALALVEAEAAAQQAKQKETQLGEGSEEPITDMPTAMGAQLTAALRNVRPGAPGKPRSGGEPVRDPTIEAVSREVRQSAENPPEVEQAVWDFAAQNNATPEELADIIKKKTNQTGQERQFLVRYKIMQANGNPDVGLHDSISARLDDVVAQLFPDRLKAVPVDDAYEYLRRQQQNGKSLTPEEAGFLRLHEQRRALENKLATQNPEMQAMVEARDQATRTVVEQSMRESAQKVREQRAAAQKLFELAAHAQTESEADALSKAAQQAQLYAEQRQTEIEHGRIRLAAAGGLWEPARGNISYKQGSPTTIELVDGRTLPAQYGMVRVRDLKMSGDGVAATIDGYFSNDPMAQAGPVVILKDGTVLTEGRLRGLLDAIGGTEQQRRKVAMELASTPWKFGLESEGVDLDNPEIPVRILDADPITLEDETRLRSDLNRAIELPRPPLPALMLEKLPTSVIREAIEKAQGGSLNSVFETPFGRELVDRLVATGTMDAASRAEFLNAEGQVTPEGRSQLTRILLERVAPELGNLPESAVERITPLLGSLARLADADPQWRLGPYLRDALLDMDAAASAEPALTGVEAYYAAAKGKPHPITYSLAKLLDADTEATAKLLDAYGSVAQENVSPVDAFNVTMGKAAGVEVYPGEWQTKKALTDAAKAEFDRQQAPQAPATPEQKKAEAENATKTAEQIAAESIPSPEAAAEGLAADVEQGFVTPAKLHAVFMAHPRLRAHADLLMKLFGEIIPRATGMPLEVFLKKTIADVRQTLAPPPGDKGQIYKGITTLLESGQRLVEFTEHADASTAAHELIHAMRPWLRASDLAKVEAWTKKELTDEWTKESKNPATKQSKRKSASKTPAERKIDSLQPGRWTEDMEEMLARAFERYLRDGKAPIPELEDVFARLKNIFKQIYQTIKGTPLERNLTPEIKAVFDSWFQRDNAGKPLEAPPMSFTTAQGSTYEVAEDGTTTRTKSLHAHHDPKDVGLKPRSAKTVYVDPKFATEVGMWQSSNATGKRVALRDGKILLLSDNAKEGRLGKDKILGDATYSETPKVGMSPLELWSPDERGFYSGSHPGNAITELTPLKAPPRAAAALVDARAAAVEKQNTAQAERDALQAKIKELGLEDKRPAEMTPAEKALVDRYKQAAKAAAEADEEARSAKGALARKPLAAPPSATVEALPADWGKFESSIDDEVKFEASPTLTERQNKARLAAKAEAKKMLAADLRAYEDDAADISGLPKDKQRIVEAYRKAIDEVVAADSEEPPTAMTPPPSAKGSYGEMVGGWIKQSAMDAQGQGVLDDMQASGELPRDVEDQFWNSTYFRMPAEAQQKFQRMLTSLTGFKPGDVIGTDQNGKPIVANDWATIAKDAVSATVEGLQGTERGYVALMREANRRFAQTGSETDAGTMNPPPDGVLPGMEEAVTANAESAQQVKADELTDHMNRPAESIEGNAGRMEMFSPLFADTAANPQGGLFGGDFFAKLEKKPPVAVETLAPGDVGNVRTAELQVDPARFQYKMNTGAEGTTNLLKGLEWDEEGSGILSVWRDPADGKTYVVNGHHRFELARDNKVETLTVRMLDAKDAAEARSAGALINIREGRGTATDAAKYFRDTGTTMETLRQRGISLGEATAMKGLALSKLDQRIFDEVVSGRITEDRAAAIANATEVPEQQEAILALIEKAEGRGKSVTNATINELARMVRGAGIRISTQINLFGEQEMRASLALEKAEISSYIRKQIADEIKTFSVVEKTKSAQVLKDAGNRIASRKNTEKLLAAQQAEQAYDAWSTRTGQIDEILNAAATALAEGEENPNVIKTRAYKDIREALSALIPGGDGQGVQERAGATAGGAGLKEPPAEQKADEGSASEIAGLESKRDAAEATLAAARDAIPEELEEYAWGDKQADSDALPSHQKKLIDRYRIAASASVAADEALRAATPVPSLEGKQVVISPERLAAATEYMELRSGSPSLEGGRALSQHFTGGVQAAERWVLRNQDELRDVRVYQEPDGSAFTRYAWRDPERLAQAFTRHDYPQARAMREHIEAMKRQAETDPSPFLQDKIREGLNRYKSLFGPYPKPVQVASVEAETMQPPPPIGEQLPLFAKRGVANAAPTRPADATGSLSDASLGVRNPGGTDRVHAGPERPAALPDDGTRGVAGQRGELGESGRPGERGGDRRNAQELPALDVAPPISPRGEPLVEKKTWRDRLTAMLMPADLPPPTVRLSDGVAVMLQRFAGQREAAATALSTLRQHDGVILAHDTGMGKTYIASGIAKELMGSGAKRGLILTQSKDVVTQEGGWLDVANNSFNLGVKELPDTFQEKAKEKDQRPPKPDPKGVFVTTWAALRERPDLARFDWDFVIADESQSAANWWSSQQGKAFMRLQDTTRKVIYASATPYGSAAELGYMTKLGLWNTPETRKPGMWKSGEFLNWSKQFGVYKDADGNYKGGNDPKKLEKLRQQLIERGQFVMQEKNMDGFKANFGQVPLDAQQVADVKSIEEVFSDVAEWYKRNNNLFMERLTRGYRSVYMKMYLERAVVPQAIEIAKRGLAQGWHVMLFSESKRGNVETLESGEQVVQITEFLRKADKAMNKNVSARLPGIADLYEALKQGLGDDVVNFSGPNNAARRSALESFQSGVKRVLFGSYAVAGTGVNLHDKKGTQPRLAIYLGTPWSGKMLKQALGRPWRYGTRSEVQAVFLVTDSKAQTSMIAQKVAPRLAALNAGIHGIVGTDLLANRLRDLKLPREQRFAFEMGNETQIELHGFLPATDKTPIRNWRELQIPSAETAKNKPMKYPAPVDDQPGSIRLFQEGKPDLERFQTKNEADGRRTSEEIAQTLTEGGELPGVGMQLSGLDAASRKMIADYIGPVVDSVLEQVSEQDKPARARQEWASQLQLLLAAVRTGEVDGGGESWELSAEGAPDLPKPPDDRKIDNRKILPMYWLLSGRQNIMRMARQAKAPEVGQKLVRMNDEYMVKRVTKAGPFIDRAVKIQKALTDEEHVETVMMLEGKATSTNPVVIQAVGEYRKLMREVLHYLVEHDIAVTIPGQKDRVPLTRDMADDFYWPHRFDYREKIKLIDPVTKEEVSTTLGDLLGGRLSDERRERVVRGMQAKTGWTRAEVEDWLEGHKKVDAISGNVERARMADVPFYRRDKGTVIDYLAEVGEATARAEIFGQDKSKLAATIQQIPNSKARDITTRAFNGLLERRPWDEDSGRFYALFANAQVLSKMTPMGSTAKVFAHLAFAPAIMENIGSLLKSMTTAPFNWKEMNERLVFAGGLVDHMKAAAALEYASNLRVSTRYLNAIGFNWVYKFDRVVVFHAALDQMEAHLLPQLMRKSKSSEHIREQLRSKYMLDDARIDAAIRNGRWSKDDLNEGPMAIVNRTLFTSNPLEMGLNWRANSEDRISNSVTGAWRMATLMKGFTFKAAMSIKENIFAEARKGNYYPLIYAMSTAPFFIEAVKALTVIPQTGYSMLTGQGTKPLDKYEQDWREILKHPLYKGIERYVDDMCMFAAMEVLQELFNHFWAPDKQKKKRTFEEGNEEEHLAKWLAGGWTDFWNAGWLPVDVGHTLRDPASRRGKVKDVEKQLLDYAGEESVWLRPIAKTIEDKMGLSTPVRRISPPPA